MRKLIILLVIASMVYSFAACGGITKPKCSNSFCTCGNSCSGDSCQCSQTVPPPPIDVKSASLYLDNSASMMGYGNDMTYINALTRLAEAYPNTKVLKCGEAFAAFDESKGSVADQLRKMAYSGASLLQEDLKEIVSKVTDSNIAFYVTDGILSGSADDIGEDREWTIRNAAGLKLKIVDVFTNAKSKGVGVSVYQFSANFNGKYWCYDNSSTSINTQRYFYVIAIGMPHALLDFKTRFVGKEYFKPKNQLHLIDPMPIASEIYSTDTQGGQFVLQNIIQKPNNPGKIEVCLKAAPLINNFAADDSKEKTTEAFNALAEKFVVTANGKKVEEPDFAVTYDEGSRCFKFLITPQMYGKKIDLAVSADYSLPVWVMLSAFFDETVGDKYMLKANERDSKTFMLLHLVDGIKQGLVGDSGKMYEATTTLTEQ